MRILSNQYSDRRQAGKFLAAQLRRYAGRADAVVLGLPRGGVPVAWEVAELLRLPLDVFLVRKLGVPQHEELAMGAIASGGIRVLNEEIIEKLGISPRNIEATAARELLELQRRETVYRSGRPALPISGRTVILVDDGLATGSSMRAAIAAVRQRKAKTIVVAVPVGAADTCEALRREADELRCGLTPKPFDAVGLWYADFEQITDDEVREYLARSTAKPSDF